MKTLDIEAVQAFVLTADLQSFTRAAEVLDTTQSAVSLKIKRLEDGLGRKLLERTPRRVRLSADGSAFLSGARALVAAHQGAMAAFVPRQRQLLVGISHHIVGADLPQLLRHIGDAEPGLTLDVRIAASRELLEAFDAGTIDVVIVLRHDSRRQDGKVILRETFGWMGAPDFERRANEPLRIATQPAPCSVRAMAVNALDAAGVAWTEAFVGGGVNTVGAAASAGLGVAALGRRVAPRGTVDLSSRLGLPALPSRDVVLYTSLRDPQVKGALHALTVALRSTTQPKRQT
ncbi:LysR family transcriptional regulator [Pandoraea sp. ISTKB]|nr:LysR family transcriptional regulator [Pandoraea sp. ISTKB]ODP35712.1 LysR family transcriptional regulator [Pandoraea sp. ISTKB]